MTTRPLFYAVNTSDDSRILVQCNITLSPYSLNAAIETKKENGSRDMRFGCVAHRARRFVGPVCVRWRRQSVRRVRVCACVVCVRAVRTRRPFGRAAARRRRRRKKYYRTLTSRHPRPTDNSGCIANTATAGGHLNHHHRHRHHHYCYYDYYYYCYYIMCTQTSHRLLLLSLYIVACI